MIKGKGGKVNMGKMRKDAINEEEGGGGRNGKENGRRGNGKQRE